MVIDFDGQGLEPDPDASNQYIVKNVKQDAFPQTGGLGTLPFLSVGLLIIGISIGLYQKKSG
ncbi:hypothetical protein B9P78_00585 [Aerococcus sp. 1KP-2016]|nr:hypothetical protein B9P78_00585 [Aerococcus sp. 1KP-2016]